MTLAAISLGILVGVSFAIFLYWHTVIREHNERLQQLDIRIHVNGIRGKSTVTRLLAGVLREGGYVTVGKTTGSAARVIAPTALESAILRRGAPTINEQIDVVAEHVSPEVEALVIECMAVRPLYQQYSQDFMVKSDVTIITNVREDHQEEMGETLEEIADSLSVTIPHGGVLITAEDRPQLVERLRRNAEARDAVLIHADPNSVADEDMQGFDYLQFRENVAIGLAVARLLGIPRRAAVEGMWKSVPDVGVVRLHTYDIRGRRILWVPLFAANDRESVIATFESLQAQFPPGATVIGLLNNRHDRGRRAELFAHMVPQDLAPFLDEVITLGAYEQTVTETMVQLGFPAERVHALGDTVKPSLEEMLDAIAGLVQGTDGVLIGMVNIHTAQAELLMEHLAHLQGEAHRDTLEEAKDPARAPAAVLRVRRASSRPRVERSTRRRDR